MIEKLVIWVKKHKIYTVLSLLFAFLSPLIIVHILFKLSGRNSWFSAEWSAGDVLGYIAGFEAFIGTVALGALALWQNQQIHKHHLESLAPALSMSLISIGGFLYLTIENTGQSEAKRIGIVIEKIENNGDQSALMLDDLFFSNFDLFPNESVQGLVAVSGKNISTNAFPQITVSVTYSWPQLNRRQQYTRQVIYNNGYSQKVTVDVNVDNRTMESDIDKVARAAVRIANYLDGRQVAKFDELNILAGTSLKNDIVEALKTKEETRVLNRTETIEECQSTSRQCK